MVALSRLVWVGRLPLLPDEVYYWDWSRRLDLGYFDHPFMAALVIRATTSLGGATPAAVRLGMVLLGLGAVALAYRLAALLGGHLAGWLALTAAATCPLYALLSLYAAPDGPLLFCWAATVYAAARAVMTGRGRYWYAAGLALGLALLSKYVAVLLVLSILLYVALFQREWLRRREPYLASLLALLVFSPNLWWNLRHGWLSIGYQLGHGACQGAGAGTLADRLMATAIYVGTQVGIVGPVLALILCAGIVWGVARGLRLRRAPDGAGGKGRALLLLACCAVVPSLLFLAVHGLAHWAAPAYFSAIVAAAAGASRLWRRARGPRRTRLLALATVAGVAASAESGCLLYTVARGIPLPSFAGAAITPTLVDPAEGWRETARAVDAVRAGLTAAERRSAVVLADSYGTAAELAFYMAGHPRVYSGSNQYTLWGLPPLAGRGPFILVSNAGTLASLASSGSPLADGARVAARVTTRARGHIVRRLDIAVLRPSTSTGADRASLAGLLAYAWQAAATSCEGTQR